MARYSVILPHYKTWKMSFYTIHQLLKHKGRHQLDIYVVDNHPQDETGLLLKGFYGDKIKLFPYPPEKLQSHGVAYDWVIPHLRTEVFCTIESDSYPNSTEWLDYVDILSREYDSGGSLLDLSGGQFIHTAGAFYKKSIWQKAMRYVENVEYTYFPNLAMKDGFPCHLMVHDSVLQQFYVDAHKLVSLSQDYHNCTLPAEFEKRAQQYKPIGRGVFHNGIGNRDESYYTYAKRHASLEEDGERHHILQDNKKPLIWRMGAEPGQFFCYWLLANNHNVYAIPTETIWMPGRENQQQERTVQENGFTHLWGTTAYHDSDDESVADIKAEKKRVMEELYNSIPPKERI
jgi:hypothetical protein